MSLLGSVASVFTNVGYILLAIFILMFMVMIHEFGHYLAGKALKFKINEFSIGFGKSLFSRTKKNGEKFSIRLIPLGGYCAFDGEDEDGGDSDTAFNKQAPWKRLIVLAAGATFNFISAIFFSFILLASVGNGTRVVTNITYPTEYNQTIQVGDIITAVNGQKIGWISGDISTLTAPYQAGEDIVLTILRNGKKQTVIVQKSLITTTDESGEEVEVLAIGIQSNELAKVGIGQAIVESVPFTWEIATETIKSFGQLITGQLSIQNIGGPVTTIDMISSYAQQSWALLLLLLPLIAVSLAVFNILPIPALDGARMVFVLWEWITKKPVDRNVEGWIHTVGLIALFAFVIVVDIIHFI